jgi:hypothetical protein
MPGERDERSRPTRIDKPPARAHTAGGGWLAARERDISAASGSAQPVTACGGARKSQEEPERTSTMQRFPFGAAEPITHDETDPDAPHRAVVESSLDTLVFS